MDSTLLMFLAACFIGGLTSGISGFAMGLVLSGIWLHILTPLQTATLIVGYALVTQGYAIWKLRGALSYKALAPFVAGGLLGVPVGTMLLTGVDAAALRTVIGVLLVLYAAYSLLKPALMPVRGGVVADTIVGVVNGVLGGLTGLTGITVTVWTQLRGLKKDAQRAVFQPVNFATVVIAAVSLGTSGALTRETTELYLLGLPLVLGGLWLGFKLYGTLDEAAFRKVVLGLLLLSGLALVAPRL